MNAKIKMISISLALSLFVLSACATNSARTIPATVTPSGANIPNPAAAYCQERGNRSEIRTAADGSQLGVCVFADGSQCDEWAYYRGECSPDSQGRAVRALRAKLAKQLHVPASSLEVASVQATSWSDDCLGLPQDGENCRIGFTPGFRITLSSAGKSYVYHTDLSASMIRQEPS